MILQDVVDRRENRTCVHWCLFHTKKSCTILHGYFCAKLALAG
uniref:Uncharacterized protein n=1 Tax=Arundo donax TaxID=35708 RepID=A0A0A9HCI3_ARUDO